MENTLFLFLALAAVWLFIVGGSIIYRVVKKTKPDWCSSPFLACYNLGVIKREYTKEEREELQASIDLLD